MATLFGTYSSGYTLIATDTTLDVGGAISNTGGASKAVYGPSGTSWTFANLGSVGDAGNNAIGILLASGGTVANSGTVSATNGSGIRLVGNGAVANNSGGSIASNVYGVNITGSGASVSNSGRISSYSFGVSLDLGGQVTNSAGATISSFGFAAIRGRITAGGTGGPITVANAGTVVGGSSGSGIQSLGGAIVTNQTGGTIAGGVGVYAATGTLALTNSGIVGATTSGSGVKLRGGGTIVNQAGGTFIGGEAIEIRTVAASVLNYGLIGGQSGLRFGISAYRAGATIANKAGGTIADAFGIYGLFQSTGITIVNDGLISGTSTTTVGAAIRLNSGGRVTNNASGTIRGFGGIYSVTSTSSTVINYGAINNTRTGTGQYGVSFGSSGSIGNLGVGGLIQGYGGVKISADGTVENAGTIASSRGTAGVAVAFGSGASRLIVDPGAVFTGSLNGGSGTAATVELASGASVGTLTGFGTNIVNFKTLTVDSGARWKIGGDTSANGLTGITIAGLTDQVTLDLTGFVATSATFASNLLTLTSSGGAHQTLHVTGSFASNAFSVSSDGASGTNIVACFLPGTWIATDRGEVRVEELAVGDTIATASGGHRRLCWIGRGQALATRGRRTAATPILVRRGALADNVPYRDLYITKGHSLFFDGVLIPAEFLVNNRSILWDDRAREVTVYHLELDRHDVLLANRAPAESYRDDGNRWLFQNASTGWDQPAKPPCAPVLSGGLVVDTIWKYLLERSGQRADLPMTEDPDTHLLVDGVRLNPRQRLGKTHVFALAAPPRALRVVSRSAVPQELGLARDDRELGVAVRGIAVRRGAELRAAAAEDLAAAAGFHAYEADSGQVWTNGDAEVPTALFADLTDPFELELTVAATIRYLDDGRDASRAA